MSRATENMSESAPARQIFIVGMNGSGTTMLLDHLANHSRVYGFPIETKSLPYYITHEREYGDLDVEENFLRLWRDITASVWPRAGVLSESVPVPMRADRSAAGIFDHIMRHLAQAEGKHVWCEKTPMHVHHLPLLANAYPNARFIHIIRDGRDCAASFHRRWRYHPVRTIARWKKAVSAGRQHGRLLGDRYYEVQYEAVTGSPELAFRELLAFLNLPYEDRVLTSTLIRHDPAAPHAGEVVVNVRRAQGYFGPKIVARMEAVAGHLLTELGYECNDTHGNRDPSVWRLQWWRFTDDMRRLISVVFTRGRIFRPSKWRQIVGRVRNAAKQRTTLKS
jgi:Sulfotransferase family